MEALVLALEELKLRNICKLHISRRPAIPSKQISLVQPPIIMLASINQQKEPATLKEEVMDSLNLSSITNSLETLVTTGHHSGLTLWLIIDGSRMLSWMLLNICGDI
jgi:hypothetical protein